MSRDNNTQSKQCYDDDTQSEQRHDDDTQSERCRDSQTEVETTCASMSGVCIFANVCAQTGIASRTALAVSVSQSLSARATTASTHAARGYPTPFEGGALNSSQMV